MNIHSQFKDYYDSVMAYGVDNHVHYVRKESRHLLKDIPASCSKFLQSDQYKDSPYGKWDRYNADKKISFKTIYIGFCGKIYSIIFIYWSKMYFESRDKFKEDIIPIDYAYSADDVEKILLSIDKSGKYLKIFNKLPERRPKWLFKYNNPFLLRRKYIEEYFEKYSFKEDLNIFFEYKVPIFLIDKGNLELVLNPPLKTYKFQKIFNPFSAYQEIEMFLSGILGLNDPDIVYIDDKYMAEQKGFDKWSFKTLPTKKK